MSLDLTQFHEVYFEESFELIEVMEGSLLEFTPGGVVTEAVHDVFRAAHSIKGGAGTFGFEVIADFTHHVEALLDEIRTETRAITAESIEALLASVDCIRSMLEAQRAEEPFDTAAAAPVREQLEGILNAAPLYDPLPATGSGDARWEIEFRPHLDIMRTGNDPFRIISELASLGPLEVETILDDLPAFDDLDPEEMHLGWRLTMDAEIPREDIDDVFDWVIDECELTIQTTAAEAATPAAATELLVEENAQALAAENTRDIEIPTLPSAMRTPDPGRRRGPSRRGLTEAQSIRVGIDKVDELINLVGELVITQSMLQEIGENFDDGHLEPLRDKLALLSRNTREIQESVMRIRMLPISFAFNRFPRLVHDLSRKLDKSVDLQLQGEQTELDKTVMEKISDPLTHLVRNALDHGIESPEERRAAGKPETGTITMTAYHESGSIVIEISDDGRGIDEQKVLARARERQIVGVEESLSQEAIHDLIFDPGFSTADEVSDISGRGVGMDVVRKNISSIGGQIHLSSVRGEGSTVSIRLPLTLAILDGQTVRVGQENFILPLVSILESIQVSAGDVSRIAGSTEVFKLRDEYLPIVRLHRIFDLTPSHADFSEGLIVVVENDRQRVGIFVDELLGQQQVVIKSLETNFRRVDGLSGATILGDGTVALILDVPGLLRLQQLHADRPDRPPTPGGNRARGSRAESAA